MPPNVTNRTQVKHYSPPLIGLFSLFAFLPMYMTREEFLGHKEEWRRGIWAICSVFWALVTRLIFSTTLITVKKC